MAWIPPTRLTRTTLFLSALGIGLVVAACGETSIEAEVAGVVLADPQVDAASSQSTTAAPTTTAAPSTTTSTTTTTTTTTTLPVRPVLSSEDLIDRRVDTHDVHEPPVDATFVSTIESPASADIIARSTWNEECPVAATDLAYAEVSFFGFDGEFHTGELLVHVDYVDPIVDIFGRLHEMRFPIEEMRIISEYDLANPSADANTTSIFTCRRSVSSSRWSRHAFGDAVDINPFHNPYVSSGRVIPALATAYVDRERNVPGVITEEITAMFDEIGWGWGGDWNRVKDWMHFSATGG